MTTTFLKAIILLWTMIINFLFANAQNEIIYQDNFDNNLNNWSVKDTEKYSTYLKNGYYNIKHKQQTGSWFFWQSFYFDERKDFVLEAEITQTSGVDNYGFGLVWGGKDVDNVYGFTIASNGHYSIFQYKNADLSEILDWKKTETINPMTERNILTIQKLGNFLHFFINGTKVTSIKHRDFFGINFGFVVNRTMNIKVDYLTIKQDDYKINLVDNPIRGFKKEPLSAEINSEFDEIMPVISPDGKKLYFTRKKHPQNTGKDKNDDIWFTELNPDSTWSKPQKMDFPVNNDGHNSVISVLPDCNSLLLMNTYTPAGEIKGKGVSMTQIKENGWSLPETIKIDNFYNNAKNNEYCLSVDQNVLLMAIERDDSFGDRDLYVCFRNGDKFTEPLNLGNIVNTKFLELSPFLAADNVTLYFSSNGHPGYGNNDIFVTRRLDNSWTNWTIPQNLGPEINTNMWDAYYTLPASGDYAYIASNEFASNYKADLFRIKVNESARPEPVVLIYGKVFNQNNMRPIGAEITYDFLKTGKRAGIAISNPKTGEYKIILNSNHFYGYQAYSKNYYAVSENIDLSKITKYTEIKRDLYLVPIEIGKNIVLKNVFFEPNQFSLLKESYTELDRLVQMLKENPKIQIELSGHTESRGNYQNLMKLSENRVLIIKEYLVSKGIAENRIIVKWYGPDQPIASNDTEDGRMQNRRVEFKIIKK